ncbi:hypothetical protein [Geoglobus ahangari]
MKKLFFLLIGSLLLLQLASAQVTLDYEVGLSKILPGDEVDCYLVITNPNLHSETIRSIVFYSDLVTPRIITDIGVLPAKTSYRLPFTFKAEEPGKYVVEVRVRTYNGSITYYMPFTVSSSYPVLTVENPEVTLGEKNVLRVRVEWPENVTVRPLFNATPSEAYGRMFEFVYYPKKKEDLRFEVEFRNGENVHRIIRAVNVTWNEMKDVVMNVTVNRNAYENEAIKVSVGVANLRNTPAYAVTVRVGESEKKIPVLNPGEAWKFDFNVMATRILRVELSYLDEMGIKHVMSESREIGIINASAVQLCSYEFDKGMLTGEVCNFGSTEVKNVVVSFEGRKYFVGTIMPEDYEVFSIKGNSSNGTLTISWKAASGDVLSISEEIEGERVTVKAAEGGSEILIASGAIAVVIVAIAIYALRRR